MSQMSRLATTEVVARLGDELDECLVLERPTRMEITRAAFDPSGRGNWSSRDAAN